MVHLFVCLFVCLSVAKTRRPKCDFLKIMQFRAMVSIDVLLDVIHWLFVELIVGPLKAKMAEIRHLRNRHDVIFLPWACGKIATRPSYLS